VPSVAPIRVRATVTASRPSSTRATVGPLVLGSGELRELRSRVDTAIYTSATREITLRNEEFGGALRLVDAILGARQAA